MLTTLFSILASVWLVVANPGENACEQASVSWQCSEAGSWLELSQAENFAGAVRINPKETLWSLAEGDSLFQRERYVCRAEMSNLKPGKEYYYRICTPRAQGQTISQMEPVKTGRFRTAKRNEKTWTFAAFVDFQPAFNVNTLPLVNKILSIADNPSLMICSGDITDYGSREDEWLWALDHEWMTTAFFAASPGDHEYWGHPYEGGHITQMTEPFGYNAVFDNPKNGDVLNPNSNYWFRYGNVVFIALDMSDSNTVSNERLSSEIEWFKKTAPELRKTCDYLVVYQHKSMYGSKYTDSRVLSEMSPVWTAAYKAAGVDLVISGHDHKFSRTRQIDGTFYLDMGSSGKKYRYPEDELREDGDHITVIDLIPDANCVGAVVNVDKKSMKVDVRDKFGRCVDYFEVPRK